MTTGRINQVAISLTHAFSSWNARHEQRTWKAQPSRKTKAKCTPATSSSAFPQQSHLPRQGLWRTNSNDSHIVGNTRSAGPSHALFPNTGFALPSSELHKKELV